MSRGQGFPDFIFPEQGFRFRRQLYPNPHHGIGQIPPGNGPQHGISRFRVARRDGYLNGNERAGLDRLKAEIGQPLPPGRGRIQINYAKALFIPLLGKVHPLQTAGINHHRRLPADYLMFMDMPQGHIFQFRAMHCAGQQHVVIAQHH